tara:strand:- start:2332 stop:2466 length:135 start_codon:yes stop_codon:yes gene_type:complete
MSPLFLLVKGETYQHVRGDNITNIYIDRGVYKKFSPKELIYKYF